MKTAVRLIGIAKRFGQVKACQDANLEAAEGEIHALVGENGAGKSTLMRILYGLTRPDSGEISLWGRVVNFHSPRQAIQAGLGMVQQQLALVAEFSVWENIVLGCEPRRGLGLSRKTALRRIEPLAEMLDLQAHLTDICGELPLAERQKIELLRVIYRQAKIIILDEPTSMLSLPETEQLFKIIRRLSAAGHTVIFISHKLGEVMSLAQRVTVMRSGRNIITLPVSETDACSLARHMVGQIAELPPKATGLSQGEVTLAVQNLRVKNNAGHICLKDISLTVRQGQIFGIAGVAGNGQEELVEAIMGLRRPEQGRITLDGLDITHNTVERRREAGLACIPADREKEAVIPAWSLRDNLLLGRQRSPEYQSGGIFKYQAINRHMADMIAKFGIRPADPFAAAASLSGGNQQKLVILRETGRPYKLLLACQPTQGLDIGASNFVYRRLLDDKASGRSILLVSFELEELLAIADVIGVMYRGELIHQVEAARTDLHDLGRWIGGAGKHAAA